MGKGKKGGKRLTKKQVAEKLKQSFEQQPGKTIS